MQVTNKLDLLTMQRFMRCLLGGVLIATLAACGVGGEREPVLAGPDVVIPPVTTTVANQPPVGSFTPTANGLTVTFNASASRDPDGTILGYQWNFGDGTTVLNTTSATVTHVYANSGTFMVNLIVLDSQGTVSSVVSRNITIAPIPPSNQAPIARFVAANVDTTAAFDATISTDPDGTITSYAWNFGELGSTNTAAGNSVTHVYARTGSFVVTLTVKDDGGLTATSTQTVNISSIPNVNPVPQFIASPNALLVSFNAAGSTDNGTITNYAWNFGESNSTSNTATGITTTHAYRFAGSYTVTLVVTDNRGATVSLASQLTVTPPAAVATGVLNDTGITGSQCYQAGTDTFVICSSAAAIGTVTTGGTVSLLITTFAPQDGITGRDANTGVNTNIDGALGFSFTKIGANGETLPANSTKWSCVKDNVTGLMWENKNLDTGSLNLVTNKFTNFDGTTPEQLPNGGSPNQEQINAPTNSIGFKNAVNSEGLCGATDWRIPESGELLSIFNYNEPGVQGLSSTWFSAYSSYSTPNFQFITSSGSNRITNQSYVSYSFGSIVSASRATAANLHLVRGAFRATELPRFQSFQNTVDDNKTGLTWRACVEGMVLDGDCFGTPDQFTHEEALIRAAQVGNGCRLPNSKELESIVDRQYVNLLSLGGPTAAINGVAFPSTPPNSFWTATPLRSYEAQPSGQVSYVNFATGDVNGASRTTATTPQNRFMVRLICEVPR